MESKIFSDGDNLSRSFREIQEPTVDDYFKRLNQHDFERVSQLFCPQGCLYAPFEKEICGREAICQYLQAEAIGIEATPESYTIKSCEAGKVVYELTGYVQTSLFVVNVKWSIELNADREIVSVTVKLLAELQDILGIRRLKT